MLRDQTQMQKADPQTYLNDLPQQLWAWVEAHLADALRTGFIKGEEATVRELGVLGMLGTMEYLVGIGHVEALTTSWSTIAHLSEYAARAWVYDTELGKVSFEPNDLNIWGIDPGRTGEGAIADRVRILGEYGLDPVERDLGLGYLLELLHAELFHRGMAPAEIEQTKRSATPVLQVAMWATMMWQLSDYGWDYLIGAKSDGSPRSPIAWGISCYPENVSDEVRARDWGYAVTPAQSVLGTDDRRVMAWGQLLYTDKLTCTGAAVVCANSDCGVVAHCLKRVVVRDPASGVENKIHLCDRCREIAWSHGLLRDNDEHTPEDLGGRGDLKDYDCLRTKVFRPFCDLTRSCKHNQTETKLAQLEKDERAAVASRVQELQSSGRSPVLDVFRANATQLLRGPG